MLPSKRVHYTSTVLAAILLSVLAFCTDTTIGLAAAPVPTTASIESHLPATEGPPASDDADSRPAD